MSAMEERIYVGGLDPPQLTAQHVAERLQQLPIKIQSLEHHEDKAYCHLTVIKTDQAPSSSVSALDIIASKYHNVKWKGCRLIVQPARPHFLERLREEIREREEHKNAIVNENAEPSVDAPKTQSSFIPRRLRIRKKFGEEAHHVDTKPWSAENWSDFRHVIAKQQKREKKHTEKKETDPSVAPPPLMHRAVHLRFNVSDEAIDNGEYIQSPVTMSSDGVSVSSDSESEESNQSAVNGEVFPSQEAYTWSDDSEESDDSVSDDNDSAKDVALETDLPKDPDQNGDLVSVGVDSPLAEVGAMQQKASLDEQKGEYQWSSDDDSSDSESISTGRKHLLPLRQVTQTDEFAAGLDDSDDEDDAVVDNFSVTDENSVHEGKPSAHEHVTKDNYDLSLDVSANLDILASLFPEVSESKPAITNPDPDNDDSEGKNGARGHETVNKKQSGFSSNGIMIRYDPTAETTRQFEIEGPKENVEIAADDNIEESEGKEEASETKEEEEDNKPADTPTLGHVYEQDKLENVFREARDIWEKKSIVSSDQAPKASVSSSSGGFAFSFDVGQDISNEKESSSQDVGTFNFDFKIPETGNETIEQSVDGKQTVANPNVEAMAHETRIHGLCLPRETMEMYVGSFFAANNGFQIAKDVENFRRDPRVSEEWQRERYNLTMDWKRKLKHAQSRIQKRMKLR